MRIQHFYDVPSATLTYVVWDEATGDGVIIDPVLDFDPLAVSTNTAANDTVIAFAQEHKLTIHWVMETHAHADHLSGAQDLSKRLDAKTVISDQITQVQSTFKTVFGLSDDFAEDGSQFDKLVEDGERFHAGSLAIEVIHTPGHTPACATFKIGDALFTGDALFMPDFGTGRCDFPAGSAADLYNSVAHKLYTLPDTTRVFVGHDYQPGGRELACETTIGQSKTDNIQLTGTTTEDQFVAFRNARDAVLSPPKLLFHSVQVNIDAGKLPAPAPGGVRYLKLPMNVFG